MEGGGPPGPKPLFAHIGPVRAVLRGILKRCPRCGTSGVFRSRFQLKSICPACGMRFEKEEGGFLGAMVLNYALATGLWVVVLTLVLAFTVPDVPVGWLLVASVIVLIGVPLWFYPRSKTTWAAVEYLVARSDPDYRAPMTGRPNR
jgi:uncharacterized protein (DUF983 family)